MRDPNRIERVLGKLRDYWETYPDMRLAQIIVNASPATSATDVYYVEDDVIERALDRNLVNADHDPNLVVIIEGSKEK